MHPKKQIITTTITIINTKFDSLAFTGAEITTGTFFLSSFLTLTFTSGLTSLSTVFTSSVTFGFSSSFGS
jgi:hypothetical protein